MSGLDWGVDEIPPVSDHFPRGNDQAESDEPTARPDPRACSSCGRLPLHEDPRAAAVLLSQIRADARDRLSRTESTLTAMVDGDRIAVAAWIQAALDRPPLVNTRARSFAPIVAVLDALWRDIYWTTPDPLSEIAGDAPEHVAVPAPHHELVEMREEVFVRP